MRQELFGTRVVSSKSCMPISFEIFIAGGRHKHREQGQGGSRSQGEQLVHIYKVISATCIVLMDNLGVQTISNGKQYILYCMNVSKKCDSMPGDNTMQTFFFPTKQMAQEVYVTLQYFISKWDRGYDGGELGSGIRRCDPQYIGVVPSQAIGARLFTKLSEDQLINAEGGIVNIASLVLRSNELNKHIYNNVTHLPKGFYDEHMLAVLRVTGFPPRIKRNTFSLNPFKYKYVETDENTVRKMGLVITHKCFALQAAKKAHPVVGREFTVTYRGKDFTITVESYDEDTNVLVFDNGVEHKDIKDPEQFITQFSKLAPNVMLPSSDL